MLKSLTEISTILFMCVAYKWIIIFKDTDILFIFILHLTKVHIKSSFVIRVLNLK